MVGGFRFGSGAITAGTGTDISLLAIPILLGDGVPILVRLHVPNRAWITGVGGGFHRGIFARG